MPVDSPASRVERVLIGLAVPLYLLTALAIADGRIVILSETDVNKDSVAYVFPALALLATLLYAYIKEWGTVLMVVLLSTGGSAVSLRTRCASG